MITPSTRATSWTLAFLLGALLSACDDEPEAFEGDEAGECADGADNDRDGDFDCDDTECVGSSDCRGADAGATDGGTARLDAATLDGAAGDDAAIAGDGSVTDDGSVTGDGSVTPLDASTTGDGSTGGDAGAGSDAGAAADAGAGSDGGGPAPRAFRFQSLSGEDPEASLVFGTCMNVQSYADMLIDQDDYVVVFPSFDAAASTLSVDFVMRPACTPTSCTTMSSSVVVASDATLSAVSGEVCLGPLPDTTDPGYTAARPEHPCFATDPLDIEIRTSGDPIPLRDARFAATFDEGPPSTLASGLLYGFITEAEAMLVELTIAGVTRTLYSVLPGGGGCLGGDQRDTYDGESGWWLYFHFDADEVEWTTP